MRTLSELEILLVSGARRRGCDRDEKPSRPGRGCGRDEKPSRPGRDCKPDNSSDGCEYQWRN